MHTTNKSQKIVQMPIHLYPVHSWFCQDPLVTGGARGLLLKVQDTITRWGKKPGKVTKEFHPHGQSTNGYELVQSDYDLTFNDALYKISYQLHCDSLLLSNTCSSKVCVCVCVCVDSQTKLAWSVLSVLGTGWEFLINAQPLYKLTVQNMRQFQSNIIIFQVHVAGTYNLGN